MKIQLRLKLVCVLYTVSTASLAQVSEANTKVVQSLIQCYSKLFALDLFSDSRFNSEERDLAVKMKATVQRLTSENELSERANAVALTLSQEGYFAKIASEKFPAEEAKKEKKDLLSSCVPELREGESLLNAL